MTRTEPKPKLGAPTNPCPECGKASGPRHHTWCNVAARSYVRKVVERVLLGKTDHVCTGCLSIVIHPEQGCQRCTVTEDSKREAAGRFFAMKAEEKRQAKVEAAILADEVADLL